MPVLQALPADSIRHVVRRVLAGSEYQWEERRHPLAFLRRLLVQFLLWLTNLRADHPAVFWALIVASLVTLAAILTHFAYLVWRALRPAATAPAERRAARPVTRDAAWHLRETARLRVEGRYADALAHRFVALILALQGAGAVAFRPWKTPAEYAGEARLDESGRLELLDLVRVLYRHLFGGAPCDGLDVDDFDRRAGSLAARVAAQ